MVRAENNNEAMCKFCKSLLRQGPLFAARPNVTSSDVQMKRPKGRGTVGCLYCDEVSNVTIVFDIAYHYSIQVTVYVFVIDSPSGNNTLAQSLRGVTVGSCC